VIDDEFVVTTASCDEVFESGVSDDLTFSCIGCSGFSDSLNLIVNTDGQTHMSGWCVHVLSIPMVFSTLLESKQATSEYTAMSAFNKFVVTEDQLQSSKACTEIKNQSHFTRYLVMVTDIEAMGEATTRHSTCTLRKHSIKSTVHCDSVRCKRGKNKSIKNIKNQTDVCCHLRILLGHIASSHPIQSLLVGQQYVNSDDDESSQGKRIGG
jgi:hypothetical protein